MLRLLGPLAIAGAMALAVLPARAADNNFGTPGGATAPGMVNMCLNGSSQAVACSTLAPLMVQGVTTSSAASGIAPVVSAAAESNHVLKAGPGNLYTVTTTIGAVAGWLLIFDATSAPVDGAVTPKWFVPIGSNGTNGFVSAQWNVPLVFATGITAVFSTTGPFTKTASATAAFSAQVQ